MHQHISKHRTKAITLALFLMSLALIAYLNAWWPWILLAVGAALAMRQWLLERTFDFVVTLIVFLGGFFSVLFDLSWRTLLPILFGIGGIILVVREYLESTTPTLEEEEEDLNQEIEEKQHGQD